MHFKDLLEKGVIFVPEGPALTPQDIAHWENIVGSPFPEQYRDYLLYANGGKVSHAPYEKFRYGDWSFDIVWPEEIRALKTPSSIIDNFFALQDVPPSAEGYTISFNYAYHSWKHVLPPDMFPLATDPGGYYLLIGLKGEREGQIFYWDRERVSPIDDPDTAAYSYIGWVANNFVELILSLEYV